MLDGAQVDVSLREQPAEIGRQIPALGEPEDRLQRIRLAQPRVVAPVEELQRLHDELDLADAAPPELDVRRLVSLDAKGAVDLALHRAHGRDDPLVEARTIDRLESVIVERGAEPRVADGERRL